MPTEKLNVSVTATDRSFTTIKLGKGEEWRVPFGFGKEYVRHLAIERPHTMPDANSLRELLGLIGYEVAAAVVFGWPLRKRVEASVYASNVYARASDNHMMRHPKPDWMPEPWTGNLSGESPTPIYE